MKVGLNCAIAVQNKSVAIELIESLTDLSGPELSLTFQKLLVKVHHASYLFTTPADVQNAVEALLRSLDVPTGEHPPVTRTAKYKDIELRLEIFESLKRPVDVSVEAMGIALDRPVDFDSDFPRQEFRFVLSHQGKQVAQWAPKERVTTKLALMSYWDIIAQHLPMAIREEYASALILDVLDILMAVESGEKDSGGEFWLNLGDWAVLLHIGDILPINKDPESEEPVITHTTSKVLH